MCRELQTSWQAIDARIQFRIRASSLLQTQRFMPPEEKNLCLSFEIKMSETRGTLNLAVPAVVSNALLRKISADFSYQRPPQSASKRASRFRKKLLDCFFPRGTFHARPASAVTRVSPNLLPATCCHFPETPTAPAVMMVGDVRLCSAAPVRVRARRAARVLSSREPQCP